MALSTNRQLTGQMFRYGIVGIGLAAVYAAVYWAAAKFAGWPAQLANVAGFGAALVAGYLLHSQWSFRGHGRRGCRSRIRFLAVNFAGYLLNCLWVWLIVDELGYPVSLSIVPIVSLTPLFTFLLNRRWAFA